MGPSSIKWIVDHASADLYDTKTDADRFTFREIVAHMADWEPILLSRMKQTIDNPGSILTPIDEGQRAIDLRYGETDPTVEATLWISLREATIRFLEENGPGNWEKSVVHPERGVQTLYDMANLELGHDAYHIEQLLHFLP